MGPWDLLYFRQVGLYPRTLPQLPRWPRAEYDADTTPQYISCQEMSRKGISK